MCSLKLLCFVLLVLKLVLSTDGTPCNTQKDCLSNECCVSIFRPIGKRQFGHTGNCSPLGQTGSSCYVRYGSASTPPSEATIACPCESPFTCHGSHMFDIPLGETGTCG